MQGKLLADENVPRPLVILLRSMGLDVEWIPETSNRGISDIEVIHLANREGRMVVTRDSDFLNPGLVRKPRYGVVYIGEPIKKSNLEDIAKNTVEALRMISGKPLLIIVTSKTIELYNL